MSQLWRAWLTVPEAETAAAERVLEGWAEAISVLELSAAARPPAAGWTDELWLAEVCVVEGVAGAPPDAACLAARAAREGLPAPETAPLADRDWAAESRRALPPRRIGRLAVHESGAVPPPVRLRLRIDAATAFGTGAHATTAACLAALDRRSRRPVRPRRVLDLGAGTGILAFAAARLWPGAEVLAADIDPAAVALFRLNARRNGLRLRAVRSDGLAHPALAGRYDLILANLLLRPLLRLAPALAQRLAPGGRLVVSGILEGQAAPLRLAFRRHGLRCRRTRRLEGWAALELERPHAESGARWNRL